MSNLRGRWRLIFMAVLAAWGLVSPLAAQAYVYPPTPPGVLGRAQFYGYFQNLYSNCGASVLDEGLGYDAGTNTYDAGYGAAQFIAQIQGDLFSPIDGQERTGAAFIVLTMLGFQGPATGGNLFLAQQYFNSWVFEVNYYASIPGKVEWGRVMTYPFDGSGTYLNSMYQGRKDCGGPKPPDTRNPDDDAFYTDNTPQSHPTIIFHNDDGSVYMLKRNCANPIGPFEPTTDGRFSYDPTLSTAGATPPPGGIVEAGSTLDLSAAFRNSGNATGPVPGTLTYFTQYGGGAPSGETTLGSDGPIASGLSSRSFPFSVTVAGGEPEGTQLCVTARVRPHTTPSLPYDSADSTSCWLVYNPHYPGIIGQNGDVHAGGNLCSTAQTTTGSITTNPQSNSLGQYVVSANGSVSGYGSNNTAGSTNATLGSSGGYYSICQPDLASAAQAYISTHTPGVDYAVLPAGSYDIGSAAFNGLAGGGSGIYLHNGAGAVTIHGTFTRKITILSLNGGTVTVDGNVTLNAPSTTGANAPSLGVISDGGIAINGAATRVDAYLFSNGTINTCTEGAVAACRNTLTVNGFLMGQTLSFRRLGPATAATTATIGEQVNLTGQLYLNPPKFFDNAAEVNLLQNQGEKPPLN